MQTDKKGFGIRAAEDIPKYVFLEHGDYSRLNFSRDAFVWEYIGEVVSHPSFMKRMREYAEEGLRHFYFMMLQKDEARPNLNLNIQALRLMSLSISTPRKKEGSVAS